MQTGVYYDLTHKEYHSIDALSRGRLSQLKRSPLHMKYYLEHPETRDSEALIMGEAFHALVLEPESFNDRFGLEPEVNKRTKEGRRIIEDLKQLEPGKVFLSPSQWEQVMKWAETVAFHPTIPSYLRACAKEVSLFWERDGVLCKARFDAYDSVTGDIYDLKTCQDASVYGFRKSVFERDYHMQAHWYLDGAKRLGLKAERFLWIPIEKKPPHGLAIRECGASLLRDGASEIDQYFAKYVDCKKNDSWPGYETTPTVLDKSVSYELT